MPYATDRCGIYAIVNHHSGRVYIGQSLRLRKRIASHFAALRGGNHSNNHLQNSWNKYGPSVFSVDIIAECADSEDLNPLEGAFLAGDAHFMGLPMYNIAKTPQAVMTGRKHSEATKRKLSESQRANPRKITPEYLHRLRLGQTRRALSNPRMVDMIKKIISLRDSGKTWKQVASECGTDPSSACRKYMRYKDNLDQWLLLT